MTATSSDWNISLNKNSPEVGHLCMIYVTLKDTIASLKKYLVEHSQVKLKAYRKEIVPPHKVNVKKKLPQNISCFTIISFLLLNMSDILCKINLLKSGHLKRQVLLDILSCLKVDILNGYMN